MASQRTTMPHRVRNTKTVGKTAPRPQILLEQQILEIREQEQARIGQDLHDGLCQDLVSLAFDANALERHLASAGHPKAPQARRIADCLDRAISEARAVSRGLFPGQLEEGLPLALRGLTADISARLRVECKFQCGVREPLVDCYTSVQLYRIAQEAITNAIRHGKARRIRVKLLKRAEGLELIVENNGREFRPETPVNGIGLKIMRQRALSLGGCIRIYHSRNGLMVVSCRVPATRTGDLKRR
jgi:signal transduction histidine kinase